MLLASIVLWAQVGLVDDPALSDIDLSDVVIIEDVAEASDSVDTAALSGFGDTAAVKVWRSSCGAAVNCGGRV